MFAFVAIGILGIGFIGILPKNLGLLRILIGPALGLYVFTQLALVFSFFLGIANSAILALIIEGLLAFLIIFKFRYEINIERISSVFLISTIVITLFLSFILLNQSLAEKSVGLATGGGGMYGDSALHAAYTSRLETGDFPPDNPLFAGQKLVYPLANDLLSATLKISGLSLNLSFSMPQILFFMGFLTIFYKVVRKISSDLGFVFSTMILFLGWGLGWLFFLGDFANSGSSIWNFLARDYTNNPDYNLHFHNILTGLVLPERTFLPGLFLGMLMFLNFLEYNSDKNFRYLIINGITLGSLPFWHTHTFIFFSITSLILGVWFCYKNNFKRTLAEFLIMFSITLIMAIPFLILFFSNHSLSTFVRTSFGWQNGEENILLFWFKNSFLMIPMALSGFWLLKKELKIFFLPSLLIFILSNFIIFQPWDWDNIKLISWSFLFFAILSGFLLAKIYENNLFAKFLVIITVLISTLSGILSIGLQLKNTYILYDLWDIEVANWAKANTDTRDIFIVEPNPNNPISGLAGRLVYIGYPGHLWVHGINYGNRESLNNRILNGDFSQVESLEIPINYIVLPKTKVFDKAPYLREVFQNQKYQVFEII